MKWWTITGIEEAQDFAAARGNSRIEGRALAAICLQNRHDAVAITGDDLPGLIRRSIIDDHDLDEGIILMQHAIDGGAKEACIIVIVDEHADQWRRRPI